MSLTPENLAAGWALLQALSLVSIGARLTATSLALVGLPVPLLGFGGWTGEGERVRDGRSARSCVCAGAAQEETHVLQQRPCPHPSRAPCPSHPCPKADSPTVRRALAKHLSPSERREGAAGPSAGPGNRQSRAPPRPGARGLLYYCVHAGVCMRISQQPASPPHTRHTPLTSSRITTERLPTSHESARLRGHISESVSPATCDWSEAWRQMQHSEGHTLSFAF